MQHEKLEYADATRKSSLHDPKKRQTSEHSSGPHCNNNNNHIQNQHNHATATKTHRFFDGRPRSPPHPPRTRSGYRRPNSLPPAPQAARPSPRAQQQERRRTKSPTDRFPTSPSRQGGELSSPSPPGGAPPSRTTRTPLPPLLLLLWCPSR